MRKTSHLRQSTGEGAADVDSGNVLPTDAGPEDKVSGVAGPAEADPEDEDSREADSKDADPEEENLATDGPVARASQKPVVVVTKQT